MNTSDKDLEIKYLKKKIQKLKKDLKKAKMTDSLTGLPNRKAMYDAIKRSLSNRNRINRDRADRAPQNISVCFIDLDEFKSVNDGDHLRGNRILIEFGNYLKKVTRAVDTVARFGGDEFFILAPNTTVEQAYMLCEKIQHGLWHYLFDSKHEPVKLSCSVAAASTSEGLGDHLSIIKEADSRMQFKKDLRKKK